MVKSLAECDSGETVWQEFPAPEGKTAEETEETEETDYEEYNEFTEQQDYTDETSPQDILATDPTNTTLTISSR